MSGSGVPDRRRNAGARAFDDSGGLWIRVGIAGAVVFYAGLVVMLAAGFTAILPFVVIPLVLVALVGANALLGGPRRRERPSARPIRPADRGVVSPSSEGPKGNGRSGEDGTTGTVPHPGDG
ncbi:MAG: hypothetical protein ACLQOZ_14695 [Acidimicrobiales bacterium]